MNKFILYKTIRLHMRLKYIDYGELFQVWEMWPIPQLEKPVGSKVGTQDPRPWMGSPIGNQSCTVPRPL